MSVHRIVVLLCDIDGCAGEATMGEWFTTVAEARTFARRNGWTYVPPNKARRAEHTPGADYCPAHS